MPTLPFLHNFKWAFVRMDAENVPAKFEVRTFTVKFWVGCEPQSWEEEAVTGQGWYRLKELLVSSYRPCIIIVTFPLSLRFSEILPLLCSSTPLFPHVPLAIGGRPLGYEERRCLLVLEKTSIFQKRL